MNSKSLFQSQMSPGFKVYNSGAPQGLTWFDYYAYYFTNIIINNRIELSKRRSYSLMSLA